MQYTLNWSPYYRLDRFLINSQVPAESGIYQVFLKRLHHLEELNTDIAYYGGLRATLREMTDGLSPRDFPYKEIMKKEPCFFRFVINPHLEILQGVMDYMTGEAQDNNKRLYTQVDNNGLVLQA